MAYTLQAFIAQTGHLQSGLEEGLREVRLKCGLVMVPLNSATRTRLSLPLLPLTDEGVDTLPTTIQALGQTLSRQSLVVYVEAESFGGAVTQAAAVFSGGVQLGGVNIAPDAINTALLGLGVRRSTLADEFEVAGLGAQRDTDRW